MWLRLFSASALDGVWSVSRPGRFISEERNHGTHWIRGRVSPRACLDVLVKKLFFCLAGILTLSPPSHSLVTIPTTKSKVFVVFKVTKDPCEWFYMFIRPHKIQASVLYAVISRFRENNGRRDIWRTEHLVYNFGFRSFAASYVQVFPVFCIHCSYNPNSGYEAGVVSFWLTFYQSLCRSPRDVHGNCILRGKGGKWAEICVPQRDWTNNGGQHLQKFVWLRRSGGTERTMVVSTCKSLCG
jgi:hypothetical protein